MKQLNRRFKKLALAMTLTLTWIGSTTAGNVRANTAINLNSIEPIEIYVPPPENTTSGICSPFITPVINSIIAQPPFNSSKWGILIQSLDGTTLYSHSPDSYLIPASNMKLLLTAAALQKLDPQGQIRSKSIKEWIIFTNLNSNNYYADILLRYLGGSQSVRQALTSLGVEPNGYRIADGSGLSRSNLVTPRAIVSILRAMYSAKGKDIFLASLPVAGTSGTLKHRLRQTTAQGHVYAKTGTLKGVRALSGYIENAQYGTLVFSIISNRGTGGSDALLVQAIDEIVLRLGSLVSCS
jgi:D-alanyl-D-alanine carboxypeptidase/D-alanyl-D-alanine-endopeptidase (penicillin-binding protein 4)